MSTTYVTKMGETVDLACLAVYGRTGGVTESVLAVNPGLADLGPILPIGTIITMPDVADEPTAKALVSLWD